VKIQVVRVGNLDKLVKILKNWPNDAQENNVDIPPKKAKKKYGDKEE
jgi:hypothetical protein